MNDIEAEKRQKQAQRAEFRKSVIDAIDDMNTVFEIEPPIPTFCSTSFMIACLQFYGKALLDKENISQLKGETRGMLNFLEAMPLK
jgi:hypothetical protein